jgi:hypothetical protein
MTMDAIKAANAKAGFYFFERATLRFFRSRIGQTVYEGPGGTYFVTSEQFVGSGGYAAPRAYTVRRFNPDGDIDTVGPKFNTVTKAVAARIARQMAAGTYQQAA